MRAHRRSNAAVLLFAVLATAGLGCGKNRVLLDVDVASFMSPDQLISTYDTPATIPLAVRSEAIPVNLVEGFKDFGSAETATMDIGLRYDNEVGQGQGHYVLYFSDDPATVYDTPPVATLDTDLQPGTVSPGGLQLQMDQRVLDLFSSKQFWMGVDMVWQPTGLGPLRGTQEVSVLHVHLESTLGLFD